MRDFYDDVFYKLTDFAYLLARLVACLLAPDVDDNTPVMHNGVC